MKVSHYKCDYGEDEIVGYIVFPSGTVMYNSGDDGWKPSGHPREHVEDHLEFLGFIEAPCVERIK